MTDIQLLKHLKDYFEREQFIKQTYGEYDEYDSAFLDGMYSMIIQAEKFIDDYVDLMVESEGK